MSKKEKENQQIKKENPEKDCWLTDKVKRKFHIPEFNGNLE